MLLATVPFPKPRFDQKKIGERLREARTGAGFERAEDFARLVKIGKDAWYKKEQGRAPLSADELNRVGEFLNAPSLWPFLTWSEAITVDRFLGRTPPLEMPLAAEHPEAPYTPEPPPHPRRRPRR